MLELVYVLLMVMVMVIMGDQVPNEASTVYIDGVPHVRVSWDDSQPIPNTMHPPPLVNDLLENSVIINGSIFILDGENRGNTLNQTTTEYYYNPCVYGRTLITNNEVVVFNSLNFNDPIDSRFNDVYIINENQTLVIEFNNKLRNSNLSPAPFFCVNGTLKFKSDWSIVSDTYYEPNYLLPISGIYVFSTGTLDLEDARIELTPNANIDGVTNPSIISFGGSITSSANMADGIQRVNPFIYFQDGLTSYTYIPTTDIFSCISFTVDNENQLLAYTLRRLNNSNSDTSLLYFATPYQSIMLYNSSVVSGGSIQLLMGSRCNLNRMILTLPATDPSGNGIIVKQQSTLSINNSIFYLNNQTSTRYTRALISVQQSTLNINSCYFNHQCQSIIIGEWGTESIHSFNNTYYGIGLKNNNNLYYNNNNLNSSLISRFNKTINGSAITTVSPSTTSNNDSFYGTFSSAIHIYQISNRSSITGLKYSLNMNDLKYHHQDNFNNNKFNGIINSIFNLGNNQSSITFDIIDSNSQNNIRTVSIESSIVMNTITTQSPIDYLEFNNCSVIQPINNIDNYTTIHFINNNININVNNTNIVYGNDSIILNQTMIQQIEIHQQPYEANIINIPIEIPQTDYKSISEFKISFQFQIIPTFTEYFQLFNEFFDDGIYLEQINIIVQTIPISKNSRSFINIDQQPYINYDNYQHYIQYTNTSLIYPISTTPLPSTVQVQWYQFPNTLHIGNYIEISLYSIEITPIYKL